MFSVLIFFGFLPRGALFFFGPFGALTTVIYVCSGFCWLKSWHRGGYWSAKFVYMLLRERDIMIV